MNLYKKIIINNWVDKKKSNIKKFEITIFKDDNIENVASKIAKTINPNSRFYLWKGNNSILFSIKKVNWTGFNINPILAKDLNNKKQLNEPIIYNYNYGLFDFSSANIIFEKDFPELSNNPYYFIDIKLPSLADINKKEKILKELDEFDLKAISDTTLNIHRYELESKLTKDFELVDLFERLNTNKTFEFIQWINDNYKIIYKVLKKNRITQDKFTNWTDLKKINNINLINCYSIINSATFAKMTIDEKMNIVISYTINLRKVINWDEINQHIKNVVDYCNSFLNYKLKIKELSIKANFQIQIENVSIQNLKKKISEYVDIFDILKSNKDTINLIYKRASNYNKQGFDPYSYIKNCLFMGIDEDDIINQLVILNNLDIKDAKQLLQNEKELIYEMEQQNIQQSETINKINTLIIIENYKNGFLVNIINIPNKNELENFIYWFSKIVVSAIQKQAKANKKIIKSRSPSPSRSSSLSNRYINSDEENLGKLSFSSSSSTSGGALGKEKHSYFINALQKADKDLFLDNYARKKCQAINQPIVMTPEYKEELIKNKNYFFDNDITYGSKKNIKNVYACPRLWCPLSKIPLDPNRDNYKCPIDGEEPMEMFFDNDPTKKRFVKLIKPDENNLCVPCCFKKEPKEDELNKCKFYNDTIEKKEKKDVYDDKDENYLVNTLPVRSGRFGIIPKILHDFLLPNVKYSLCSKSLNKYDKCFVRKGINHRTNRKILNIYNDSIISSIANCLDFNTKDDFANDIIKKLDLITFISLENGNVCKSFIDLLPLIPEDNEELIIELKEHLKKFKINFGNIDNKYTLSRLLGIFKSYKKFIDYIKSNDFPTSKSPYYLYSLITILYNVLPIIWEKSSDNISLLCPYYTTYEDLISTMELNSKFFILIKEKNYYEPLELKSKNSDGEKLLSINDYPQLNKVFNQCKSLKSKMNEDNIIYNNLYSLNTWIKTGDLKINKKFIIKTVLINSDLSLSHFITDDNIIINFDKISCSYLPRILIDFEIKDIVFYDDLIETSFDLNVLIKDYKLFTEKCNSLKVKYDFGELKTETQTEYYYTSKIKKQLITNDIIHSRIIDDLYKYNIHNRNFNKKWFQLQLMIYMKILSLSDKKFEELLGLNRSDRIKELFKILKLDKNPNKNKLRIILEELPFNSKLNIKKYLNNFIIYYKYDFLNPLIKEEKKQFVFSQTALQHSIPSKLLIYHPSTPNTQFSNIKNKDFVFNSTDLNEIKEELPEIFTGTIENLNSKWVMHKKSKWVNMVYLKNKNYNIDFIKNFYLWLAKILNIKTSYEDLEIASINNIKSIFLTKNYEEVKPLLKDLFDDPYFSNLIFKIINKKYTNFNVFIEKYYSITSMNERKDLLNEIIKFKIFPNDFFIIAMSKILNINIITIHRSKYGANDKDKPVVRGDIDDLLLSSTFYKAPIINYENRPLIILYKYFDTKKLIYNLIIDKKIVPINEKVIYFKLSEVPMAIKYLIEEHIKKT